MKKLMIVAMTVLFSAFFAGSSFAAYENCDAAWAEVEVGCTAGTAPNQLVIKGSKSVLMQYKESSTPGLTYSLGSYHKQGNRIFGSSSGDQKLYWIAFDGTTPADLVAAPTGTGGSTWTTGWSAL